MDDESIKDYLFRIRNPDMRHAGDVVADAKTRATLASVNQRLTTVRDVVGFGNFNVLSFDEMLEFGRRYSQIGEFTRSELDLLESLFTRMLRDTVSLARNLSARSPSGSTCAMSSRFRITGHYVFSGKSLALYEKVLKQVGGNLTLTSGCAASSSRCSSSSPGRRRRRQPLAGIALIGATGVLISRRRRFRRGYQGWGERNFTDDFASTDEFRSLLDLGYIDIRYPKDNRKGVRFEPWHIKVT